MNIKEFKSDERSLIVGTTGSGKTFFLSWLLNKYPRFVLLNLKPSDGFKDLKLNEKRIMFVPTSFTNLSEQVDEILNKIYEKGNQTVSYDELVYKKNNYELTEAEHRIYRLGRERNIGVITATQKPSKIPAEIYDQSQRFFIFSLLNRYDRSKFTDLFGDEIDDMIKNLKQYEFVYVDIYTRKPEIFILKNGVLKKV